MCEHPQLLSKEPVERLFLPFPTKPQRFSRRQITHHREELLLLPQMDLIDAHLPQGRLPASGCPARQITQIDAAHGAGRQPQAARHPSHRGTLAGLPDGLFEALAERGLAGQLLHLLTLDPAIRTAHPVQLDHHRRAVLKAGQIAYLPLVRRHHFTHPLPATGAHQLAVPALPPHPQTQSLGCLVDLASIDPITWPPQNLRPLAVGHPAKRIATPATLESRKSTSFSDSRSEPKKEHPIHFQRSSRKSGSDGFADGLPIHTHLDTPC